MHWLNLLRQIQSNQQKISSKLFVLIIVFVVWLIGSWVWLPVTQTSVEHWIAHPVLSDIEENMVDLNKITSAHLFGAEKKSARSVPSIVNANAPKTKLNLKLVGLVFSESSENSLAIISSKGAQDTYGIGDVIDKTRAKLKAVLGDRIIIDNSGRDETLFIDENITKAERENLVSESLDYGATNESSKQESDYSLDEIKESITSEPGQFLNYVSFSEFRKDGQIVGYKIKPGKSDALFVTTDLEPGDVVIEINGVSVSDSKGLTSVMADLLQATEVDLVVERDGRQEDIHIQF